jgi:hypothetical protein
LGCTSLDLGKEDSRRHRGTEPREGRKGRRKPHLARRLEEEQKEWRERPLKAKGYPYLYLDATYLKPGGGRE